MVLGVVDPMQLQVFVMVAEIMLVDLKLVQHFLLLGDEECRSSCRSCRTTALTQLREGWLSSEPPHFSRIVC